MHISRKSPQELKELVRENEFFKTRTDYPPVKEDESLVAYILTITLGSNAHTTCWTDVSKEVPDSIIRTVKEIKRIETKEIFCRRSDSPKEAESLNYTIT